MGAGWAVGYEDPTGPLAGRRMSMKKRRRKKELKLMSYNVKGQRNMNAAFID